MFAITKNPVTVGYVARAVVAVAAIPVVYTGFNDQPSGQISLTETSAGYFAADPTSPSNTFGVCLASTSDNFTRLPMAIVTSGDLKLAAGSPIAPATQAMGTYTSDSSCVYWTVYTTSTVASTIQIRGTDAANAILPDGANNGPRLSIANGAQIGYVQADVRAGFSSGITPVDFGRFTIAVRANKNEPVVAALSQPTLAAGTAKGKLGDITISETQAGQFKQNETICLDLAALNLPSNYPFQARFVYSNVNDRPVVTTNTASGLLAQIWELDSEYVCIQVTQQAIGTLGTITLSNLNVSIPADAAAGPINVRASGGMGTYGNDSKAPSYSGGMLFDQTVTAGKIGVKPAVAISSDSALGLIPNQGAWSTATKVQKLNKYVTWRFTAGSALAGKLVQIQVAAKNSSGGWGLFGTLTSAMVDSSGVAYFQWRQKTPAWLSVRAYYPGDISLAESWSPARQARWR